MTIQTAMLVALGFLAASLLGLLVASAFWSRAVRLTTARIKQSMPVSETEIKADRDRLRAEYAIKVHKLETQIEHSKLERARHLIEINRRDANISSLETNVLQLKTDLEENLNARRVLEQTVADRLPRVEARLAEAKRLLFNRDREIAELTAGAKRHKQALEEASSINAQQTAEIDRLTTSLTTRGGRNRQLTSDVRYDGEVALRSEMEALRTKTREQANLIDRLQRRLGPPAAGAGSQPSARSSEIERARQNLSEAEAALSLVRSGAADEEATRAGHERELRALRAKAEDQAGEIARLKAALAAFEQGEQNASVLKESKVALKARLNSAQAQADQQGATINRLRAELAAAHERLAKQASHFMNEMRRVGAGTVPASGQLKRTLRDAEHRRLAERVVDVRASEVSEASEKAEKTTASIMDSPTAGGAPSPEPAFNGHHGSGSANGAREQPAAESPKPPEISEPRRRPRLLERISGIGKS